MSSLALVLVLALNMPQLHGVGLTEKASASTLADSTAFGAAGQATWTTTSQSGTNAGEPSIGISHKDGIVHDALYQSGITTYKVHFDADGTGHWTDVTDPVVGLVTAASVLVDPILSTDHATGRTFAGNLEDAVCGVFSYTDDDGANWNQAVGTCALPAWDHETVAYGPWHTPVPTQAVNNNGAAYYCAQEAEDICWTSYDGGMTFTPLSPAAPLLDCESTFGHVKIAPDGTVYIPDGTCIDSAGNLKTGFMFSEDNGQSWSTSVIEQAPSGTGVFDPSLAVTDGGWVYIGNAEGADGGANACACIALTKDHGATWESVGPGTSKYYDVRSAWNDNHPASEAINAVEWAEVTAGDNDRAAFAFLGSHGTGDKGANCNASDHVWSMYVALTYDAGKTWQVTKADPDPVQYGKIASGGTTAGSCRNLLDFNGIDLDADGRVYVAYADGCVGCSSPQTTDQATIARQLTGQGLYAAKDTSGGGGTSGSGSPAITITSPTAGATDVASPVTVSGAVDRNGGSSSSTTTSSSSSSSSSTGSSGDQVCVADSDSDAKVLVAPDVIGTYDITAACAQNQAGQVQVTISLFDMTVEDQVGSVAASPVVYEVYLDGSSKSWDVYHTMPAALNGWTVWDNNAAAGSAGTASSADNTITVDIPYSETGGAVPGFHVATAVGDGDIGTGIITTDSAPDSGSQSMAAAPAHGGILSAILDFFGIGSSSAHAFVPPAPLAPQAEAAQDAPATPPSDPQITDASGDVTGLGVAPIDQMDIQSAWFDSDADYLYVGMKLKDIPADPATTSQIAYTVNFHPTWTDTWPTGVATGDVFNGLRVDALWSRVDFNSLPPTAPASTTFALEVLSSTVDPTTGASTSHFGKLANIGGSVDVNSDIIWFQVPQSLLAGLHSGDTINQLSAATVPAVGGLVTLGSFYGDGAAADPALAYSIGSGSSTSSSSSTTSTGSGDGERVELYEGSTSLGSADVSTSGSSPTASWAVAGLDLADGDHTVTAEWFDAGVPSTGTPLGTATVTFTVGGATTGGQPYVTVTQPSADGSTVSSLPATFAGTFGMDSSASGAQAAASRSALAALLASPGWPGLRDAVAGVAGFEGVVPDPAAHVLTVYLAGGTPADAPRTFGGWAVAYMPDMPVKNLIQPVTPAQAAGVHAVSIEQAVQDWQQMQAEPSGPALPGLQDGIGPGSAILVGVDGVQFLCSSSFLYVDPSDASQYYLSTAGHCLLAAESGTDKTGAANPDDVNNFFELCYASCIDNALQLGTYVTVTGPDKVLYASASPDPSNDAAGIGRDVGFLVIPKQLNSLLRPYLTQWGGPDDAADANLGDLVVHYGHGTYCCPSPVGGFASRTPLDQGRVAVSEGSFADGSFENIGWLTGGDSGSASAIASVDPAGKGLRGTDALGTNTHGIATGVGFFEGTLVSKSNAMVHAWLGFTPRLVTSDETIGAGSGGGSGSVAFTTPASGATLDKSATPSVTIAGTADFPPAAGGHSGGTGTDATAYYLHRMGCGNGADNSEFMDTTKGEAKDANNGGDGCGSLIDPVGPAVAPVGLQSKDVFAATPKPASDLRFDLDRKVHVVLNANTQFGEPRVVGDFSGELSVDGVVVASGSVSQTPPGDTQVAFDLDWSDSASAVPAGSDLVFTLTVQQAADGAYVRYGGDTGSFITIPTMASGANVVQVSVDDLGFTTPMVATGTSSWSTAWDLTSVAAGPHTLRARALQDGVQVGDVASRDVTVAGSSTGTSGPSVQLQVTDGGGVPVLDWTDAASQDANAGTWSQAWNPAAPANGAYTLHVRLRDGTTDLASATRTFTLSVATNQAPTARFTSSMDGLSVSVDGTTSSDPDSDALTYAWAFGDGATATGATATHAYAAGGLVTVSLTVDDGQGHTASVTHDLTLVEPPQAMAFGTTYDVALAHPTDKVFTIEVAAGLSVFRVAMTGPGCTQLGPVDDPTGTTASCDLDADLYVKHGSAPTVGAGACDDPQTTVANTVAATGCNDCAPLKNGNDESCDLAQPAAGTWYVVLDPFAGSGTVHVTASLPADSDHDGTPDDRDSDIDGDGFPNAVEGVVGSDPSNPGSTPLSASASTCIAWDGNVGEQDRDGDGIPAVYANHGQTVTVGADGSVTWGSTLGRCWILGDPNDDGTQRAPALPVPDGSASTCIAWDGNVVQQDNDHDGIPALYAPHGQTLTVHSDGTLVWGSVGKCWIAGDADDDGIERAPESPLPEQPLASACVPWTENVVQADRDHDGVPALYGRTGTDRVTVGSDGSLQWQAQTWCWMAGDPDDDGVDHAPAAPVPTETASVCVPWTENVVEADRDHDGLPALYGRTGTDRLTVGSGGSMQWQPQTWCWIAGDVDDDGVDHAPHGDGFVASITLPSDPLVGDAPALVSGSDLTVGVQVFAGPAYSAASSGDYRLVLQVDCGALQPVAAGIVPGSCAGGDDVATQTRAYAFTANAAGNSILVPAGDLQDLLAGSPATALHVFVETAGGAQWSNYAASTEALLAAGGSSAAPAADLVDHDLWDPVLLVDGSASPTSAHVPADALGLGGQSGLGGSWTDALHGLGLGWLGNLV